MKKFIFGKISLSILLTFSLFIVAFFLGKTITNVSAHGGSVSNKGWVATSNWSSCVSKGPQCGTSNGTQSRTLTCQEVAGANENCSLGTWIDTTYKACPIISWDYFSHHVNVPYEKSSDPSKCHRPSDNNLRDDYGMGNTERGWFKYYNSEWKDADVDVAGHYQAGTAETRIQNQDCILTTPDYRSCTPAGTCPTACGQAASQVPNGRGGFINCPATNACPLPVDCAYHYSDCSATCGEGTKNLIIDTPASNGGIACPTETTISCGELPICETDQCTNIDGDQFTVPDNYYQTEGEEGLSCFAKTAVCGDITANNYSELTNTTYSDNSLCSYTVDLCKNIDGIQTSVPEGLHINATGVECEAYGTPGVEQPTTSTPTGEVLGASTISSGKVLGASTMAGTGSFAESLYLAIMGLGGISTIFGIKGVKKASKKV